jgi:hypothetical protein
MRALTIIGMMTIIIIGLLWVWQESGDGVNNELNGTSSDPNSPQAVGNPIEEIDPQGPAPKLYQDKETIKKTSVSNLKTTIKSPRDAQRGQSQAIETMKGGVINPDAVEYYRKRGLLGSSTEALAVLRSQTELWQEKGSAGNLSFEQVGGGLSLTFETDLKGQLNGAIVEVDGGGASARLMTIEMWMSGMENPWELYWETERPGPIAGTIPTHDDQELHYYCDMVSMDDAGSLNHPSRCHFRLNEPTPELQRYLQQPNAKPLQKAKSRLEH